MSFRLNLTDDDVYVIKHGDRVSASVGPLLRASGWRGGQFCKLVEPQYPLVAEYTVEKSDGIEASGFILFESEDYSDPRRSTYRNYTSFQNAIGGHVTAASGTNVVTFIIGGGRFLFLNYEREALDAGGVRNAGLATFQLNRPLLVSENGLLCQDPEAFLMLATGGAEVLEVGRCSKVPSVEDPRLGLDFAFP